MNAPKHEERGKARWCMQNGMSLFVFRFQHAIYANPRMRDGHGMCVCRFGCWAVLLAHTHTHTLHEMDDDGNG